MKMFFSALASALCLGVACGQEKGFDRESFANPDSVYSPGFFWMWNAKLDVAQLKAQLDDMVAMTCAASASIRFRKGSAPTGSRPTCLRTI